MKVNAEIEPVYILGDFSVKPAEKGWEIEAPVVNLHDRKLERHRDFHFIHGVLPTVKNSILKTLMVNGKLHLDNWHGTMAEVTVNGQHAPVIAFPPYHSDITGLIKPGINKIDVNVIGSLKNLLGPHHNNPKPGFVSPWTWRNVNIYPSGKEYQMLDYGLFEDFTLLNGK